jgi:mannose-6-phosphate isomerase-like protein (cupin superfamily)
MKKGFVGNIEKLSEENEDFRRVLYTAKHEQLVLMSLRPGEDIGEEVHDLDQFLRIEHGEGVVIMNDIRHELSSGFAIIVPAGTKHNIINTSQTKPMKLYTVYGPPAHKDKVVRKTKVDAEMKEEHFDGKTTE